MNFININYTTPSTWYEHWLPLSSDISEDSVKKVVSSLLYNFMAWVLGFSEEPEETTNYINIEESSKTKLLSLCQDMVYNCSKGKTQTLKSLALAMFCLDVPTW